VKFIRDQIILEKLDNEDDFNGNEDFKVFTFDTKENKSDEYKKPSNGDYNKMISLRDKYVKEVGSMKIL